MEYIVALIAGGSSIIGTVIVTIFSNKNAIKIMQAKYDGAIQVIQMQYDSSIDEIKKDISRLECKQDKHNNLISRMAVVEAKLGLPHNV